MANFTKIVFATVVLSAFAFYANASTVTKKTTKNIEKKNVAPTEQAAEVKNANGTTIVYQPLFVQKKVKFPK